MSLLGSYTLSCFIRLEMNQTFSPTMKIWPKVLSKISTMLSCAHDRIAYDRMEYPQRWRNDAVQVRLVDDD